jgi:two-component system, OmpR family, response regulator ResD
MRKQTVLVVDDETTIREVVRRYLERDGFHVIEADTGTRALEMVNEQPPDLIVLDIMLPGIDGLAITRRLRNGSDEYEPLAVDGNSPIIMLTARTHESERVAGLEIGADDYVTKPFSPQELVARIKAVLRRTGHDTSQQEKPLIFESIEIDPVTRLVTVQGQEISLTAKEFDLLWHLARHPRQVFTRTQLLDQVWGYDYYGDDSTVTVHVRRLREKIEPDAANPTYVQTVWGIGYKFEG